MKYWREKKKSTAIMITMHTDTAWIYILLRIYACPHDKIWLLFNVQVTVMALVLFLLTADCCFSTLP